MRERMRRFVHKSNRDYSPLQLFSPGVFGFWHDYTDPSTWFQDTAGTTPSATLGDPVGRVNDKSGNGVTGLQSVSAARPTRGRMPLGGVRNRMLRTSEFTNSYWDAASFGASVSANTTTAPDGTLTADSLIENSANSVHLLRTTSLVTQFIAGLPYTQSWHLKANGRTKALISFADSSFPGAARTATFDLSAETATPVGGGTATITSVGDGWFRCSYTQTADATDANNYSGLVELLGAAGTATYLGDGVSGMYIWGSQLEQASEASAYQKVVQAYDVTESGVASVDCLWFDGADDYLDLTATGAGLVRNTGRFTMFGAAVFTSALSTSRTIFTASTGNSTSNTRAIIRGQSSNLIGAQGRRLDADAIDGPTYAASMYSPIIMSGVLDYAGALAYLRKDGALVATDSAFQTAGNTPDTDSMAVRVGEVSAVYYNGFISGIIAVKGATLSDAQLRQTELYLANQIGVTI